MSDTYLINISYVLLLNSFIGNIFLHCFHAVKPDFKRIGCSNTKTVNACSKCLCSQNSLYKHQNLILLSEIKILQHKAHSRRQKDKQPIRSHFRCYLGANNLSDLAHTLLTLKLVQTDSPLITALSEDSSVTC